MTYFQKNLRPFLLFSVVTCAGLSGCAHSPNGADQRPAFAETAPKATELEAIVALLEKGDEKAARKALKRYIKRNPADAAAPRLLDSITADPLVALGEKNFEYRVQPGEHFTDLAQRFLGDRFKFYALARYNGVGIPGAIHAGQSLKIPGDAPRPPRPVPPPRPIRAEPQRPEPARPVARAKPSPMVKVDPARAAKLRASALAALNQGEVARAVVLLHQASQLDPGNKLIKNDLYRAQRIRQTVKAKR